MIRDFYEGGMILFDPALAYRYERHLRDFLLSRRRKYYHQGGLLWSYMMDEYERKQALGQYAASDYHAMPGDPLVGIPDVHPLLTLKRRKLTMLEFQAFKLARRRMGSRLRLKK